MFTFEYTVWVCVIDSSGGCREMMRAVIKRQDSVVPRIARIKDHRRWGAGRTVLLACDSCDSDIRYLASQIR